MNQVEFFQQYSRLYGFFSGLAVYAADALNLVAKAAHKAGTSGRVKLRDALEGAPYDGLAGEYVFSTLTHGGVDQSSLSIFQMQHTGWSQA
jgi:branched-chain amino acid transport system substrate-binding protein